MASPEILLSSCSAVGPSSSSAGKVSSTPAIQLHDISTLAHVHSFKSSSNATHSLAVANSEDGVGGTVWSAQEGKAIAGIWAWQKDQQHMKLHLPEQLRCLTMSPNRIWVAGGSSTGHIYLWEVASGLLLASWNAHYRDVTTLNFSNDSALLVSSSEDAAVHVFLVARLLDDDTSSPYGKPYGSLTDHTLAVTAVTLGRTAGSSTGCCFTASKDGTVKMWSLLPTFDLLATFTLPLGIVPTALALDPTERFVYVGSTAGNIYHIPLFKRKAQLGQIEAVGGDGRNTPSTRLDLACIVADSPVTCMALSLSATQLIIGTQSADIHIYSLPSHQHLRTLSSHPGPISHVSTMLCPPDLIGRPGRPDDWPVMDIRQLERMRLGRAPKDVQEVTVLLRTSLSKVKRVESLRGSTVSLATLPSPTNRQERTDDDQSETAALQQEVKRLRASLAKAVKLNEKMWNGVVDLKMGSYLP